MVCGVYEIVNISNGKRYVGSSVDIERRWAGHRHRLRKNISTSHALKAAWAKYGEENFVFRILELCDVESLIQCEQKHIDQKSEYNIRKIADSNIGRVISDEERAMRSVVGKLAHANNPDLAAASSERVKAQWENPDWAAKTSESIRQAATKAWADPLKKKERLAKRNTPEYRATMSSVTTGENNPRYDPTLYDFISPTGEVFTETKLSINAKIGLSRTHLTKLCSGKANSVKGWTIKKAPEGA